MIFPREARAFPSPFSSPCSLQLLQKGSNATAPLACAKYQHTTPPPPSLRRVSVAQPSTRRRNGTHVRMYMYIPFPGRPHTGRGLGRARPTSRWPSWAGLPRSLLPPPPPRPRPRPPPSRRSRTRWGCPARGSSSRRAVGDICRPATGGGRTGGTEDTAGGEDWGGSLFTFRHPQQAGSGGVVAEQARFRGKESARKRADRGRRREMCICKDRRQPI